MRNRYKKMADFGISKPEEEWLYNKCLHLTDSEKAELYAVALIYDYPMMAEFVVESLTTGRSYDAINKERNIPMERNNFYAHRRRTLAKLYETMIDKGLWVKPL